jgi:hypothetical protein
VEEEPAPNCEEVLQIGHLRLLDRGLLRAPHAR